MTFKLVGESDNKIKIHALDMFNQNVHFVRGKN